jgi:hypothetical protein
MSRLRLALLAAGGAVASLALTAAQRPTLFAQTSGGLWEVSGVPGTSAPVRQCLPDVTVLAQFEHRARACSQKVTSDNGTAAVIDYSCGASGFGHSRIDLITPRSLRIDTQGISDRLPFSYVLQARRVGDCQAAATAPRH